MNTYDTYDTFVRILNTTYRKVTLTIKTYQSDESLKKINSLLVNHDPICTFLNISNFNFYEMAQSYNKLYAFL